MEKNLEFPEIPYDIYESNKEILIIIPLGGVKKDSLSIRIENYRLFVEGERVFLQTKETLIPLKESCYRGKISQVIDLPSQVYLDTIHSKLSPENILEIIVPKVLVPEKIDIEIQQ